jgi:predicted Zn-dependent protease
MFTTKNVCVCRCVSLCTIPIENASSFSNQNTLAPHLPHCHTGSTHTKEASLPSWSAMVSSTLGPASLPQGRLRPSPPYCHQCTLQLLPCTKYARAALVTLSYGFYTHQGSFPLELECKGVFYPGTSERNKGVTATVTPYCHQCTAQLLPCTKYARATPATLSYGFYTHQGSFPPEQECNGVFYTGTSERNKGVTATITPYCLQCTVRLLPRTKYARAAPVTLSYGFYTHQGSFPPELECNGVFYPGTSERNKGVTATVTPLLSPVHCKTSSLHQICLSRTCHTVLRLLLTPRKLPSRAGVQWCLLPWDQRA